MSKFYGDSPFYGYCEQLEYRTTFPGEDKVFTFKVIDTDANRKDLRKQIREGKLYPLKNS